MLIEMPVMSFLIEETDQYRKWSITTHSANRFIDDEPNVRYQVVVKFGKHELTVIPIKHYTVDLRSKDEEEALIGETILPFVNRLFSEEAGCT